MQSEIDLLRQRIIELEAENAEILYLRNKLSVTDAEIAELKRRNIEFLRANKEYNERHDAENAKLKARIIELEQYFNELKKKSEIKKNRKFQTRCIQIAKEILNEKPMIKYRLSFMQGLKLDTFFQKY